MTFPTPRRAGAARLAAACLLGFLAACGGAPGQTAPSPAAPEPEIDPSGPVALDAAAWQAAGIRTARAGSAELTVRLRLTAVAAPNLDTRVHVNPKAPGIVRAVHVKLGDRVETGTPLCEIHSVDLGNAVADYLGARAAAQAAQSTLDKLRALYARRVEIQRKVLDGAVAIARTIQEREKDLKDRELTTLRPYLQAEKELKLAELERERTMTALLAERDARLLELEVALHAAEVGRGNAENRLHIFGLEDREVAALEDEQGTRLGRYVVQAPSAGIITRRDATLNEFAGTDTQLFQIDNLARAWIEASVYEQDLTAVGVGQPARIVLNAFPGHVFQGRVTYIGHAIDATTRAAPVRIEVDNDPIPEWKEPVPIRPGMFGTAELTVERARAAVVVPPQAVVRDGTRQFVFVATAERTFEARDVELGRRSDDGIEVRTGVRDGEVVAVAGTFVLKSLLQREKLGGDED
jgi:RND family efflux transporter MFP subunit